MRIFHLEIATSHLWPSSHPPPPPTFFFTRTHRQYAFHGSYNLEKVFNFSGYLEKSLNSVKVHEKYLISLLGLEKSLKLTT